MVLAYHAAGALPPGTLVKLYFAAGGYLTRGRPLWGVPPITEGLDLYLAMLGGHEHPVGRGGRRRRCVASPVTRLALERGGHLRVGLEDDPDAPATASWSSKQPRCAPRSAARSRHSPRPSTS